MGLKLRYPAVQEKREPETRGDNFTNVSKAECVHALKGLTLLRASHSSEIALAGSRRLRFMLAAAPVLFAHAIVTAAITHGLHTLFLQMVNNAHNM